MACAFEKSESALAKFSNLDDSACSLGAIGSLNQFAALDLIECRSTIWKFTTETSKVLEQFRLESRKSPHSSLKAQV